VAKDGDPAEDAPPRGLTLWWPRSGFALALWLLTGVVVSGAVGATLLVDALGLLVKALPFGRCGCPEPPPPNDPWYQSSLLRFAAVCLLPFAVMWVYQLVATLWVNRMRLHVSIRILLTIALIVGGLALWWLLLGLLVRLLM
jgi:hypothetical protein